MVAIDGRAPERQAEIGPVDAGRGETVTVPVEESVVGAGRPGDVLAVVDGRGRSRLLHVVAAAAGSIEATSDRTVYFVPGVRVDCRRDGELIATGAVGSLPTLPGEVRLRRGEVLRVRLGEAEGTEAERCDDGSMIVPATISVEIPELFRSVRAGHRLLIDDGRIEGVVTEAGNVHFDVEIRRPEVAKVRPGKGINLPDSALNLPALARQDLDTLRGMAPVADLIALSYVADADDVDQIHAEFDRLGSKDLGVVLKIETRAAFEALPRMLLRGLRRPPVAVMIARGDLGVEVGFERLAELQEEILCLAEAAHVPVIWATQVLESLAKTGSPTRSEVSDAAWAGRAECVMLNKGPHIVDAIRFLDDVLTRMGGHGYKRTPMLRRLAVAESMGSLFDALDPDG
jgi:pyruvate kinase